MPSLITHALFAQDVLDALHLHPAPLEKSACFAGAQGPDFLFYHNAAPLRGRIGPSRLRQLGSLLHREKTDAFYRSALESIWKETDPAFRAAMEYYVCGHLCHWALDCTVHPYVYARVGWGSLAASSRHHRFESQLDTIWLKEKTGLSIRQRPAQSFLDDRRCVADVCASVYLPAARATAGLNIDAASIENAWKDFKADERMFHDPSANKARRLSYLEKLTGLTDLASGFIIPASSNDFQDVLNSDHRSWVDRADGRTRRESFFELYDLALTRARQAIRWFRTACAHPELSRRFLAYLQDRDYEKGVSGGGIEQANRTK